MLKPGKSMMGLLLALTGCYTGGRQAPAPVPRDWKSTTPTTPGPPPIEQVVESPRPAPPPIAAPEAAGSSNNPPAGTWISLDRWSHENGLGPLRQISPVPTPAYALDTTNGPLVIHINNQVANWRGVEFHLAFDPRLINGQPFVHVLDLKKNMEPLLITFNLPLKTTRTVVIDPGHGGQNTGTRSIDGIYEKEYTLDWARRVESLLSTNGWQVILTRTNDVDVSLPDRIAIADENAADLFISLHFNSAAPGQEQAGLETYCLTPPGMPSTLTRGYEDDSSLVFPNNAFDAQNLQYAFLFQRTLLSVTGTDRGVRHARFLGVLRGQDRPAILIEGGYLSNPREAHRIADPGYRQELAEAVAAALTGGRPGGHSPPPTGSMMSAGLPVPTPAQPAVFGRPASNSAADNLPLH